MPSIFLSDEEYLRVFKRPRGVPLNQPYNPNSQNPFSDSSSTQIGSTSNDLTSSLFGNTGGSFLDIAKTLAQQKADLAKAERGDISGYRTREMAQQAGYRLGEIKEQGGIQKGLEELRQGATTERQREQIASTEKQQQKGFDFQQAMTERNRAAALSAGRAGSMFY